MLSKVTETSPSGPLKAKQKTKERKIQKKKKKKKKKRKTKKKQKKKKNEQTKCCTLIEINKPHREEMILRNGDNSICLFTLNITKTSLYNFHPLKAHFYIVNLGFTGYTLFFLISTQTIDCGYSLEPPRRGGSNEYP